MEQVLKECKLFIRVYLDDIIVFSNCWSEHLQHIKKVLGVLRQAGLTAKPSKCAWGHKHLLYLGHIVGCGHLAVTDHRVTVMAEYKRPETKKGIRRFLDCIEYYKEFVKDYALYSALLTPSTPRAAPDCVVWIHDMIWAFMYLRQSLYDRVVLSVPSPNNTYVLCTDSSVEERGQFYSYVYREGVCLTVGF